MKPILSTFDCIAYVFSGSMLVINISFLISVLSAVALISTIIYNTIRIYKDIKNKK